MRKRMVAFFLCVVIVLMGAVSAYADGSNFAIATVSNAYRSAVRTGSSAAYDYEHYNVESPSNPKSVCEYCGAVSGEEHRADCLTRCICGMPDGVHLKGCVLYVEGTCTCNTETLFHDSKCAIYVAPETAVVYTEKSGVYSAIENHGINHPIDMKKYDGETIYVLESEIPQQIYFTREILGGLGGAYFSVNESEYVKLELNGAIVGDSKATLTLASETPAGAEFEIKANKLLGKDYYTITIVVLDELPGTKPGMIEQIVDNKTFMSTEPIRVSVTGEEKQIAIKSVFTPENGQKFFFFDIDSDSESAEITIDGLVPDCEEDEEAEVVVLHLLDNAEAIVNAVESGMGIDYFVAENESEFTEEINAAKAAYPEFTDARVYYTYQAVEVSEDGEICFSTDSFSSFIFVVALKYNGLEYVMGGGGTVTLTDLLNSLEVKNSNGEKYGVDDVSTVVSSDETVMSVAKSGADWNLTSKAASSTEVYLTVTFKDGKEVKIKVTDPAIYYYLSGTNWSMETTTTTLTPSGTGVNLTNITKNKVTIPSTDIASADEVYVYLRPGMAWGVASGTTWPGGSWKSATYNSGGYLSSDGNWTWIWDGSVNYALASSVSSVSETSFKLTVGTHTCKVTMIIIPESGGTTTLHGGPTLVEDTLDPDSEYEIASLPITLYNYDGKAFNNYYNTIYANKNNDSEYGWIGFKNLSKGVSASADITLPWSGTSQPNSGNISTGVMKNRLQNNLPVVNGPQNTDLFSTNTLGDAKKVYTDVEFQFLYNKENGYYTYSSNLNHAQFDPEEKKIKLYNETLAPSYGTGQNNKAGFYPFEDINEAFLNRTDTYSYWHDKVEEDYFQQTALYAKDVVATNNEKSTVDMHFGIQIAADFYMPSNNMVDVNKDGVMEELVYEFTGDDDLWVFIDDQLVLDLGGAHTAVSGTVNFTTKQVSVGSHADVKWDSSEKEWVKDTSDGATGAATWTFDELGIDIDGDEMHTLRVFYMERWSGESNCRMHFNLPIVPNGAVTVGKQLRNQDGDTLSVTPDIDYTFQIFTADDNDDDVDASASEFTALSNKEYTIVNGGTGETDENGYFKLKPGQVAQFTGIDRFTEVYVVEMSPKGTKGHPNDVYEYTATSVAVNNGEPKVNRNTSTTDTVSNTAVMPKTSISYAFVNYMKTQPLTFTKNVVGGTDGLVDVEQEFEFALDFKPDIVEDGVGEIVAKAKMYVLNEGSNETELETTDVNLTDGGSFILEHGESLTIPRVPVHMTYDLGEKNPDTANGSFDKPVYQQTFNTNLNITTESEREFLSDLTFGTANQKYSGVVEESTSDQANVITVVNQQRFDFELTKKVTGITDPDQSFLFEINGVEGTHTADISVQVVVPATKFENSEAMVTVADLPVGQYTVKEDTNWSWRYTVDNSTASVNAANNGPQSATFTNERTKTEWLDGSSWCKNLFDGNSAVETENATNEYQSNSKLFAFKREDDDNAIV